MRQLPVAWSIRMDRTLGWVVYPLHALLYRLSGGAIGGRYGPAPVLLLTTTGRKTGKRRTVPLLYLPDGESFVVVGSNGARSYHPAWYLNLTANPAAEVQTGRSRTRVTAIQPDPAQREDLWRRANGIYPNFDGYQARTTRRLPVVVLSAAGRDGR